MRLSLSRDVSLVCLVLLALMIGGPIAGAQQDHNPAPGKDQTGIPGERESFRVQCGRACAAMALERYDIAYTNAELEQAMPVDADGRISAESVMNFLTRKGLEVTGVQTSPTVLMETQPTAILYEQRPFVDGATKVQEPHFVIVIAYDGDRICLYNPDVRSNRTGWVSADRALEYWTGEALLVSGPSGSDPAFAGRIGARERSLREVIQSAGRWVLLPVLPIVLAVLLRRRLIALPRAQGG
ncbi:MAG: hypothetical protein D8M59_15695 [Planctomycetes bacterium]|nr:hypothetical protein [Planctomycetota bacterium]NOG54898.1 hypothetical protein [Planctomycetota bacterium]